MSFIADSILPVPVDVAGGPYRLVRRVKCFTANSSPALETAINLWLATLEVDTIQYVVGTVNPYSTGNNNFSAVVSYGFFLPA